MMACSRFLLVAASAAAVLPLASSADEALPFQHKAEVYRSEQGDVIAFRLRLEQPFLAEEFEKSNYLRLEPTDKQAHLIYPKETRFEQKHAEFYGRLQGEGVVALRLSYEMVSENPDGSRRVEVREGTLHVTVPHEPVGPQTIYQEWAARQNDYFLRLLKYYPQETFYQYCLLQSRARYGVTPPEIPKRMPARNELETQLYHALTGSLSIQQSLQYEALSAGGPVGDLTRHVSTLRPPQLQSLRYEKLLQEKRDRDHVEPAVHEVSRLVPHDQYLLHFNTVAPLSELVDLSSQWGDSLLRLYTVRAQDPELRAKLEDQLCVQWQPMNQLFADGVLGEIAITGADPLLLEGTDVTMILRVLKPEPFQAAAQAWVRGAQERHPDLVDRDFNYRGHKVVARYTTDRAVSAFVIEHGDYVVYSNSHRAIRRLIDVAVGMAPNLHDEPDYQYVTMILPPSDADNAGYLFASEAAIKRLLGPEHKISQKRRLQCFNNLVMLNNASLFYRLEHRRSPESLSELIEGGYVDREKVVCPHGGGYTFDAEHDMCTCSLHNRLRYLTPNVELTVLKVSEQETDEYDRYKQRYESFWKTVFDPLAVRITVDSRVRLETCVLPFANSSLYQGLRNALDTNPQPIGTEQFAPSSVVSMVAVPGREKIAAVIRTVPGVSEVLQANPTLTDLKWLGDRFALHFCDGETILQIDPTRLAALDIPLVGHMPVSFQAAISAGVMAANLPVYVAVDVESPEQAAQLLEQLAQQVFLKHNSLAAGLELELDAYRLPDYKDHAVYAFGASLYLMKLRLHAAIVGDQLVVATKPEILREVIDASTAQPTRPPVTAHLLLRMNRRAINRLHDDLHLYWAEKARQACHRNIAPIYNLCKLYDVSVSEVDRLSETKYGVRYFCPDRGDYLFHGERDEVTCTVHGNREHSRQHPSLDREASFARFMESIREIVTSLEFQEDGLIATLDIERTEDEAPN